MPSASAPFGWARVQAAAALGHLGSRLFAALYVLAAVVFRLASGDWLTLGLQGGLTVWRQPGRAVGGAHPFAPQSVLRPHG